MQWDIVNTEPIVPRCIFCDKTTNQMIRFMDNTRQYKYICSNCARYVKDAMNKWEGLKSVDYIEQTGSVFNSKYIDDIKTGCNRTDLHRCNGTNDHNITA